MEELKVYYRAFREYKEKLQQHEPNRLLIKALLNDSQAKEAFNGKLSRVVWDEEWIDQMVSALPFVEHAAEEQRRFIESYAEIRRIDQARKVTEDSVRYLAQHANMISRVDGEDVVPDKVLIVERDDNYAIYENRFLYTLILRMQSFLEERYSAVADLNEAIAFSYQTERTAVWNRRHVQATLNINYEQRPPKARNNVPDSEMTCMERLTELRMRVSQLAQLPLMRMLKGVSQVSTPIVRTNVFKKNENFKRALELFEYLDGYRRPGYEIIIETPDARRFTPAFREDLCQVMALETFVGQMGSSDAMRKALEDNYRYEEELAEKERIRLEEERERQVQARISAAREEEIEIRKAEVAKREAIIAERDRELESIHNRLDEARQQLASEQAENRRLEEKCQALENTVSRLESELERLKGELSGAQLRLQEAARQAEEASRRHEQAMAYLRKRMEEETTRLREQAERDRQRAQQQLDDERRRSQEQLTRAQQQAEQEAKRLEEQHSHALEQLKVEQEREAERHQYELAQKQQEKERLETDHRYALEQARQDAEREKQSMEYDLQRKHQDEMNEIRHEAEARRAAMENQHRTALEQFKREESDRRATLEKQHAAALEQLRRDSESRQADALNRQLQAHGHEKQMLQQQADELRRQIERLQEDLNRAHKQLADEGKPIPPPSREKKGGVLGKLFSHRKDQ